MSHGRLLVVCCVLSALSVGSAFAKNNKAKQINVNCDQGKTITQAITQSTGPVEIVVSGLCAENVLIEQDDVAIVGTSGAKLTGVAPNLAAILAVGAKRLSISNLLVEGSGGQGIEAHHSDLTIDGITSSGNTRHGLLVIEQSRVSITSSTFNNNGGDGIGVWDGSQATLVGAITCDDNTRTGIIVSSSSMSTRGAPAIHLHGNSFGFFSQLNASAQLGGFVDIDGSTEGLSAYDGATIAIGGLSSTNHGFAGVVLFNNGTLESWTGAAGAAWTIDGNQFGIWVEDASSFFRLGPTTITGSDLGVFVDGSNAVLRFFDSSGNSSGVEARNGSVEIRNSSFDEGLDLSFGTRVEGKFNTLTSVACDGTVVSQLDYPCGFSASLAPRVSSAARAAAPSTGVVREPMRHTFEP